jgi:hypothetical protein
MPEIVYAAAVFVHSKPVTGRKPAEYLMRMIFSSLKRNYCSLLIIVNKQVIGISLSYLKARLPCAGSHLHLLLALF